MKTIQPLQQSFKINEDAGDVQQQIHDRVQSEDNYTWAKGYPLVMEGRK